MKLTDRILNLTTFSTDSPNENEAIDLKVFHLKDLQPDIGSASLHRSRHVVRLNSGEGSRNLVNEVLEVRPDADISFGVSLPRP